VVLINKREITMHRYWLLPVVIPATMLLISCSRSPEGLFIDNCKRITANLVGGEVSWTDAKQTEDSGEEMLVNISYTAGGKSGASSCQFTYQEAQEDVEDGEYETSPSIVLLNGQQVSQMDLLKASRDAVVKDIKESTKQIDEMAGRAADAAKDVAQDAAGKARDIAHDAAGKIKDAAGNVQQALEK
jgi:hypothetical protein